MAIHHHLAGLKFECSPDYDHLQQCLAQIPDEIAVFANDSGHVDVSHGSESVAPLSQSDRGGLITPSADPAPTGKMHLLVFCSFL